MVDTHCHLYDREAFPDPEQVVHKANEAGVNQLVVIGINLETSRAAIELAHKFSGVFATVGFHPNHATEYSSEGQRELHHLAKDPRVVAIGEIGLDYHWDFATPEEQRIALFPQMELAREVGKPMVFHCREALDDLLRILKDLKPPIPAVLHCFAGDQDQANQALEMGCYLGFDGPLTYKKNHALRDIAKNCPMDRILIETDAPYLSPEPLRGKRNEPANVSLILAKLAEIKGTPIDELDLITTQNACRLFGLK
jgi:TatD DNase family protein